MTTVALSVTVERSAEDVLAVLTHVEHAARWSRAIEETLLTPGPIAIGSRRRAVVPTFAGRTSDNMMERSPCRAPSTSRIGLLDSPPRRTRPPCGDTPSSDRTEPLARCLSPRPSGSASSVWG